MTNNKINIGIAIAILALTFSCRKVITLSEEQENGQRPADWTTETHSNNVEPNYGVVFEENKVHKIHIVFTSEEWAAMQADLSDVLGGSGGGPGGGGGGTFSDQTPLYFAADFYYNDKQWYNVGVRYKGNSSLTATNGKLPLRFKFDKFEDEYPEINNQRFFGFKELAMSSAFKDESLMREKSACDIFRSFGVPATRTAFYEIYIDKGTGSYQYFGLYTMNEVVFDSFLKDYFGSETGNCYKPDGDGAKFSTSGFDLNDFEKKTNETLGRDDITAMYTALHANTRTSNPTLWKAGLEATFDVDGFLKYLAVNNTIQNWDTYGVMTHNYYLYNDPVMGKLRWIVWDNNEALSDNRRAIPLAMNTTSTDWPLINFLINDAGYETTYKAYVKSFANSTFAASRMSPIYSAQQSLISTSVGNEVNGYTHLTGGIGSFNTAVSGLNTHNPSRVSAANIYAP
jgi:spore coat protein H